MEIKNSISNLTNVEVSDDLQYIKNNTNTCKRKLVLFKYGLLNQPYKLKLWLPDDVKNIIIYKHIFIEIQLQKFLKLVAEGEQEQAEAMLQEKPDLNLLAGDVTDLSKRSFNNITGLQYAVWALDFHMWTMLLKYLRPENITKQLKDMETGSWVDIHGKSSSWQNLIDALDTYIRLYHQYKSKPAAANRQWKREVNDAQALLPVHVVNEYCHPNRSFSPCPNFKDATPIPRFRQTRSGEWFTAKYNGDSLGTGVFAFLRGGLSEAAEPAHASAVWPKYDCSAIATLLGNREEQQQALFAEYIGKKSQVQFCQQQLKFDPFLSKATIEK